ncbi:methyltransferase domain-containing protein [Glacieibacterium frigidum]|uniref:Methyltransferase domain-containing protein n=2 Tax=Glacieibacterium frigidum TaxID=2593303 RepID=A0A552UAX5_9SPHN|nr:methyltransferase domain-containing protein [Glacieibacterium frigidum]
MTLRANWLRTRNRLLSSPRFQAWAGRFPLTRPRARAEAAQLFDLVAGFIHSQVLAAVVELRLCERLADGPQAEATLAKECDLPPDSMRRLLRAAASLGLVEPLGGDWALGPRGAALLGNLGVMAMVAHHGALYADLADPVALLRRGGGGGALAAYWGYARAAAPDAAEPQAVADYSTLMAASQPMVAAQVVAAYDFSRHRRLLDVGGGEGAFVRAVAAAVPGLDLALFDLPAVAARARVALDSAGLTRVATHGGSFFADDLPTGCDVVTLVRILHDHDDDAALALLRRVRAALPPGGTLVIAEPMADAVPGRVGDAYFGLYLLAMGSGRARSPAELTAMLQAAGFVRSRTLATDVPLIARIIVATN